MKRGGGNRMHSEDQNVESVGNAGGMPARAVVAET